MKSRNCGEPLQWLWRDNGSLDPEGFVLTDYAICPACESIYRQVIHSRVVWIPVEEGS